MWGEWREIEERRREAEGTSQRVVVVGVLVAAAFLIGAHFFGKPRVTVAPAAVAAVSDHPLPRAAEPIEAPSDSIPTAPQPSVVPARQNYVGVYECMVNGQRVVSDQPCGDDAKARTLVVDRPDPAAVARLRQQTQAAGRTSSRSTTAATAGDNYCLYVRSRVTGDSKAHTCRWFNSFQECQDAASRIGAWCGLPK